MTPQELIAELRELGPQDTAVIFGFLADRVIEADLANGKMLLDVTDFEAWLRELAEAARLRLGENVRGWRSAGAVRTSDACEVLSGQTHR